MESGRGSLRRLWAEQDGRCFYCRRPMTEGMGNRMATLDHFVPQARGGGHGTDNLVAACFRCNQWKGDEDGATFAARLGRRRTELDEG